MKRKIKSWWLAVVSTVCWTGAVFAADIQYVADNGGGEYSGSGYGISVSVSAPANGVTIKYAESAMGPWLDELTYKDVCTAKPIYFQISAEGYTTVVDSRTVTVTPKTLTSDFVWLVFPTEDYVYDGTAKIPDAACGDGEPSIITDNDFSVSYSDNVNAGTAKATFTGKGNYTGTVEEEFEILKADNEWTTEPTIAGWTYGQAASEPSSAAKNGTATVTYGTAGNPGGLGTSRPTMPGSYVATFTVPESQNYKALSKDVPFTIAKATINYVADGSTGEYCGIGYGITVTVSTPSSGVTVKYSETDTGPWQDNPITFKDVCTDKPIYFQIEAEGYKTVTNSRTVTVTPKTLTSDFVWLVFPSADYVYDGTAKIPDTACGDGEPSIITDNDFTVSYSDNVNAGTAKATFTGKGNYTGTVEEEFEILKADNEWTAEPTIAGWTYGQAASEPSSAAKNGTATVTYGTAGNPGGLGTIRPTMPGSYVATFTVAESQNYKALTKNVPFTITAATINYIAENVSGVYSGAGLGIASTISVSTPASGTTVKYAESDTGPWQDNPITFKDVCTDKPIYFQIEAEGYKTVVDFRTVTITPKTLTSDFVWLVLPTEDYVYDGTAKTPDAACGDGDPSIITPNDFSVSYSDNVNAGTAKATFTGKGNYTGTVEEEFEIKKAKLNGGDEPGAGTVPTGGLSKFDVTAEYDGAEHTVDSAAILAAWQSVNAGVALGFALKDTATDWTDAPVSFVDVCETSIWYKVTLANYEDFVKEVKITITPRDIANVTIKPIDDITFTGAPVEPVPMVTDGNPSIVSTEDYTLSYENNDAPGTAKLTLTGKNNYAGTKSISFNILGSTPDKALLKAEVSWKFLRATGTYFAQLKVTCTNGLDAGLSDLRFVFADRMSDGNVYASLWDSLSRAAKSTKFSHNGDTYRYVALDAEQIQSENTETVFGVGDIAGASIPVSERTIELYVRKRIDPSSGNESAAGIDNFVGYVGWVSGGETNMIPVVSGAASTSVSRIMSATPMTAKRLNTSLAVGVALDSGSNPYCRLVEFSVEGDILKGKVEVGADTAEREAVGAIGKNAAVVLLGAARLGDEFSEVCKIDVATDGSFTMTKPSKCKFFKLRIDVSTVVE